MPEPTPAQRQQSSPDLPEAAGVASTPAETLPPGFRLLALMSLLAAACPLIPVPFVDDWCLRQVRRRTFRDLLDRGGQLAATDPQLRALAGERRASHGCLALAVALPLKAVFYFIGKLFKKIVFLFTLRDCVHRASELFAEGYLVRHALALGAVQESLSRDEQGAEELRAVIEAVLLRAGSGPVRRVVRGVLAGSWGLLVRAAKLLRRSLARRRADPREAVPVAEEEGLLAGLADRMAAALWMEGEYRRHLEQLFVALYYHCLSADRRGDGRAGTGSGG